MKNKETLEEVAERLYPTTIDSFTDSGIDLSERDRIIFTEGAKWMQDEFYSEEEVIELLNKSCDYIYVSSKIGTDKKLMPNLLKGWFNQFKKK